MILDLGIIENLQNLIEKPPLDLVFFSNLKDGDKFKFLLAIIKLISTLDN